jgi:hypothetical protein
MTSKNKTQNKLECPSYEAIIKKMEDDMKNPNCPIKNAIMCWYAEFGELNYELLKDMWDIMKTLTNYKRFKNVLFNRDEDGNKLETENKERKRIRRCASIIANRGGITALRANYYVFIHYYPKISDFEENGENPNGINNLICWAWEELKCKNHIWRN